jgi:hypothetical protein
LASCRDSLITNCGWNRAGPDLVSFDIAFTPVRRFAFRLRSLFFSPVTQEYSDFSGLYCSMTQILDLLSYIWVLLWELCSILASSPKISARDVRCQILKWLAISYTTVARDHFYLFGKVKNDLISRPIRDEQEPSHKNWDFESNCDHWITGRVWQLDYEIQGSLNLAESEKS